MSTLLQFLKSHSWIEADTELVNEFSTQELFRLSHTLGNHLMKWLDGLHLQLEKGVKLLLASCNFNCPTFYIIENCVLNLNLALNKHNEMDDKF